MLWSFLDVYVRESTTDIRAGCRICALSGVNTLLFLKSGVSSNGTKHFEGAGRGKRSETHRTDHLLAALYLSKSIKGGPPTRVAATDGTITQFMRPVERRSHHVRFVHMQVMTATPNAFSQNDYVRDFLAGFRIQYTPPALGTILHHLTELVSFISSSVSLSLAGAKAAYNGVPWAHICLDLWTGRHSRDSYGAITLRFTKLEAFAVEERPLGVWRCAGRHDHANIRAWLTNRLGFFDLGAADVASSTTDSGANVRKAMIGYSGCWMPCASHSLHNAVRHALGASGETPKQRATRMARRGAAASRHRKASRNNLARELLGRLRATVKYFAHADVEAQRLRDVPMPDDPAVRGLLTDVVTRWGSTYLSLCRLYSMWPRLSVYFRSASLTTDQRRRRVSHRDWDMLRHLIAVLTPVFQVTKASESSTETLADIFTLLVSLRQTLLSSTMAVPKFPEAPQAVGGDAIEAFLTNNPDENVFELDNRLYLSENAYVDDRPGFESLCEEAQATVHHLRSELDRLFFNVLDKSKNWLCNNVVLAAVTLTPGGGQMLREIAAWLKFDDPTAAAKKAVRETADQLAADEADGRHSRDGVPSRSGRGAPLSDQRASARSSLVMWGSGRGRSRGPTMRAQSASASLNAELLRFGRLSHSWNPEDARVFWREHREQLPTVFLVSASALGAVGTSVSCEKEFSFTGRLVRADRSTLSAASVEMHSLLAANADLLPRDVSSTPSLTHAAAGVFRGRMNTFAPAAADDDVETGDLTGTDEDSEEEWSD